MRQFVVSDIHGQFPAFAAALRASRFSFERGDRLRILGDAYDRGPQSLEMYRWIRENQKKYPALLAYQGGNHEWMFRWWLSGRDVFGDFFRNGGWATVASFLKHLPGSGRLHKETPVHEQEDWRLAMLAEYHDLLGFLSALPLLHEEGDAIFVHAGIDPSKPIHAQTSNDLLWIREDWIEAEYVGKTVVFGHTPVSHMQGHNQHPWMQTFYHPHPIVEKKVGIDGGAGFSGGAVFLVEWPSRDFYRVPVDAEARSADGIRHIL